MFVRLGSVHSRAPWGSSGSFGCVRSIPARPEVRRFSSDALASRSIGVRVPSGVFARAPLVR